MKRFYKLVSINEEPEGGLSIQLDSRPVKTSSGKMLLAPTAALAQAIAGEWSAQGEVVVPDSMPLTQFLNTAQDRVAAGRPAMRNAVLAYLETDLLRYRAERPHELARRQAAAWDPWLDWFEKEFGHRLDVTGALSALSQPEQAKDRITGEIDAFDDYVFTVFQVSVAASGSLILAMAFVRRALNARGVFDACHVEEQFKAEIYREDVHGLDPQEEKRQNAIMSDLKAGELFLDLLEAGHDGE